MSKRKLIRLTTIGLSIDKLLEGQLAFLNTYYNVIAVSRDDKELHSAINREKVAYRTIPFKRTINFFTDIKCLYLLVILFKNEKPCIIHANTPKASLLSMIAGYVSKVPIRIYTVTGLRFEGSKGIKRRLLVFFEKMTCYFATNIIPEGEGVKKVLLLNGITSKPLTVLANGNINGIDTSHFSLAHFSEADSNQKRKDLSISSSDFVFLFVGRLVKDKGIGELVDAFVTFQKEHPNSTLLLVGPFEPDLDPLPQHIVDIITQHSKIKTTGYQQDVRPYFAMSNVFVFPSYREGFPNVVLQAAAMKLPCIVSNIIGSNEIVTNNVNGFIVPPKNTMALYEAMKELFLHPELTKQFTEKAYTNVTQKYKRQQVWDALLKEYKRLENNLL